MRCIACKAVDNFLCDMFEQFACIGICFVCNVSVCMGVCARVSVCAVCTLFFPRNNFAEHLKAFILFVLRCVSL